MALSVLYSALMFTVAEHLTERDDLLSWRGVCRHIEPQVTKRLLATLESPLNLQSVGDTETFHAMAFRGGSPKGRLAWFTGHIELTVGYIPPTHLQLVLDIFEHAHGITGLSVKDFDTTVSSFLVPVDSGSATGLANEAGEVEVEVESSDALARRLLASWARNRSLTKFSIFYRHIRPAMCESPCQWRSDAVLEKEQFPFVSDLSIHLGGKPIGRWYRGWRAAFPNAMHLTLTLGNGEVRRGAGSSCISVQVR